MRILKTLFSVSLVLVLFSACWETTTGEDEEGEKDAGTTVDAGKSARLVASADSVVSEMISAGDDGAGMDEMTDYLETAAGLYKEAAAADPSNSKANFGAALFSFQAMFDNADMKMLAETLADWAEGCDDLDYPEYYVTRYFLFGEENFEIKTDWGGWEEGVNPMSAFMGLLYLVRDSLSKGDLVALLQETIDASLIGTLDEAIAYMDRVPDDEDFTYAVTREMTGEDEELELDLGEAYFISASMRVVRASLKILNAYRLSVPGVTGAADLFDPTTMLPLVKKQDLEGGGFLTLRSTSILPSAKRDLLDALALVDKAAAFIRAETDDQMDDLIKKQDLTEADGDIDSGLADGADVPVPLLRGTGGISELTSNLRTMLSGPFEVEVEDLLGGTRTVTIDISAFLDNAVPDVKKVLPYHRWVDLDSVGLEFEGPGIEAIDHEVGGERMRAYWLNVLEVYSVAAGDVWNYGMYKGGVSRDGVFTVEAEAGWDKVTPLDAGAQLTTDGGFYLDSRKRLCVTPGAYDKLNAYVKSVPRDSWEKFNIMQSMDVFPKYNFSFDHPYGVRGADGVFMFAGTPCYADGVEFVRLTDAAGNYTKTPVFPDPTFGGVLPGMTQSLLLDTFDF